LFLIEIRRIKLFWRAHKRLIFPKKPKIHQPKKQALRQILIYGIIYRGKNQYRSAEKFFFYYLKRKSFKSSFLCHMLVYSFYFKNLNSRRGGKI